MRNRGPAASVSSLPKPVHIRDARSMEEVCQKLAAAPAFAFDTEFIGEDNYEPEICLVQAATDTFCAVIDPLTGLDLSPFWKLVTDPAVRVIVHAGTEDLAICARQGGHPPENVFDVQIGAGLIGLGYPISLTRLVQGALGIKLHKSQTLTDWRRRPLSPEQIEYAALDVLHLPALYRHLQDQLTALGRVEWAEEECAKACSSAGGQVKSEQRVRRLRGSNALSQRELVIADALLEERDLLAREYDRPPRTVLRDHLLVELARRGWTDPARVRTLRGLNLSRTALERLVGVIKKAKSAPLSRAPQPALDEDTTQEEVLLALATAVIRDFCFRRDISFALMTTKQDLRAIVRKYTRSDPSGIPISLLTGWRKRAVGDLLDRLLSGRSAVRVVQTDYGLGLETGSERHGD